MQGYNNYSPYQNQIVNPRLNTMMNNNGWGNNWNQPRDGKTYVNGRAGADVFPLPPGVNVMTLWDSESKRFYIKGYDNNGVPRVLEDNDYMPHIEPPVAKQNDVDLSAYATKEDIKNMIAEAFSNSAVPNMTGYVTREEMDKAFSELMLGNGGRIVRSNDSNG